ncbi:aconitate hydratase AcnA [Nitrincola nitratireducens]|uniref:Aconitate hydratase A n=1 Tax=Nitrincola nitratireducens TaxID=1229521 RepID=W9VQ72_9GAMM|nr:aconitate hydratase AcnA [Nitrincola nitratireducens]EXJ12600.1 Aconitate hydratase [Nitrincola nitratireducens]
MNTKNNVFHLKDQIKIKNQSFNFLNLEKGFGCKVKTLPVVLKLLLINVCQYSSGRDLESGIEGFLSWLENRTSTQEVPYQPGRVLMHDTTSTPALVDIAAMRDTLREAGKDAKQLTPTLHVDVAVDHSLAVEVYASSTALADNTKHEIRRNYERYRFLRWAAKALGNVTIHPPGTGIMHTINLEQLASVVKVVQREEERWLIPDMMLGTDSHTPMINGIGVLGWGVGGLEAQTVMFGMPTMIRIPDVVGVKLIGKLAPSVQASDIALTVTHRLRKLGVSGEFVEFFGPGVSTLTASARSVIANMAPEYGATTGFFPVDDHTITYLKETGRSAENVELVEKYIKAAGLWFDPIATPVYTTSLEIDLGAIGYHAAGPKRPQDIVTLDEIPLTLNACVLPRQVGYQHIPRFPVAIAAITSCTNTSDPALLMAAGIVAKKALALGLNVPSWVKTSLAPGSPAAQSYLDRANLLAPLNKLGFGIVGFGCTTCIGNSGPLTHEIFESYKQGFIQPVAILSGNRNFPGRVHPDIDLGYITSPALVVIAALSGDAEKNLISEPVQINSVGKPVYLSDLWPSEMEIKDALAKGVNKIDFIRDFTHASLNPLWDSIEAPDGECFPWDDTSTILRRPPFASIDSGSLLGEYEAYPLMIMGDDVTTDHISPASAIPPESLVADFLVERGELRNDLNVFASRRGNWEVMLRATFHNKSLVNLLTPSAPVVHTMHIPSKEILPIWEASQRYESKGESVVIVAGERYGMGSSRDWAAKGQRLLGVRAVLAVSFERIHRSNLIGMGILPLILPEGLTPYSLDFAIGDRLKVCAPDHVLVCRGNVQVQILRLNGHVETINAILGIETQLEIELLRVGGVLPMILNQTFVSGSI